MSKIDPAMERARLAARYAEMSDHELEEVGQDPSQLTEWARSTLADEMRRRGMEWRRAFRPATPIKDEDVLMRLGTYEDRNTAGVVREFLLRKGITAFFLEDEPLGPAESGEEKEPGHTQLLARARDLASARALIAENEKAELELQQSERDDSTGDRPVLLRTYRDMPQAFVEKSVLDDAGIPCFLQDDNVIRMDWLWSNGMGGIKLMVRQKDAIEADRILTLTQWGAEQENPEKS